MGYEAKRVVVNIICTMVRFQQRIQQGCDSTVLGAAVFIHKPIDRRKTVNLLVVNFIAGRAVEESLFRFKSETVVKYKSPSETKTSVLLTMSGCL